MAVYTFKFRCSWCGKEYSPEVEVGERTNIGIEIAKLIVFLTCECGATLECEVEVEEQEKRFGE
ncbi:MAG TPA: hypothetical protein EYP32_04150 [Aquificaceae bacterium]|nr:hypothetical protein [Aquificaceae bacterium]